jgi:hypothetical protein
MVIMMMMMKSGQTEASGEMVTTARVRVTTVTVTVQTSKLSTVGILTAMAVMMYSWRWQLMETVVEDREDPDSHYDDCVGAIEFEGVAGLSRSLLLSWSQAQTVRRLITLCDLLYQSRQVRSSGDTFIRCTYLLFHDRGGSRRINGSIFGSGSVLSFVLLHFLLTLVPHDEVVQMLLMWVQLRSQLFSAVQFLALIGRFRFQFLHAVQLLARFGS